MCCESSWCDVAIKDDDNGVDVVGHVAFVANDDDDGTIKDGDDEDRGDEGVLL